jgi:hypothetical protein
MQRVQQARQQQLHLQQQERHRRSRGPRVLQPEGTLPNTPGVALRSSNHKSSSNFSNNDNNNGNSSSSSSAGIVRSRTPSPGRRAVPVDYPLPSDTDDLVTVVRVFIQHELLKFARRNRLAGSPLGHRRAGLKPPQDPSWQMFPRASMLADRDWQG